MDLMRMGIFMVLFCMSASALSAQKALQLERAGSPKTVKLPIGTVLTYRIAGDPVWYTGEIANLIPEDSLVVFNNRYVKVGQLVAFRRDLGWPRGLGKNLFWFGAGWSGFALVGTATDGIPETNYAWSDAIVTGSAMATSWLLPRVFQHKTTRFGKSRRLRIVDLAPKGGL